MKSVLAATLVLAASTAFAAPGDFDTSFGTGGFATVYSSARPNNFPDIAVDASGNVFATGNVQQSSGLPPTAVRLRIRADGTLDPAFGSQGQTLAFGRRGVAVRVDAQGRPIVIDAVEGGAVVERLLDNGVPDPEFGTVSVPGGTPMGVARLPDGTLVLLLSPGTNQVAFSALAPDLSVDPRWVAASASLPCPALAAPSAARIVEAPGNRVVVVMAIDNVGLCLARFNANGSIDGTFGIGGHMLIPAPPVRIELQGIAVDREGTIAVAYAAVTFLGPPSAIAFVTTSGALDAARGLSPDDGLPNFVTAVAFQRDGKLLVTGYPAVRFSVAFDSPDLSRPMLVRFAGARARDPSFGPAPGGSVRLVNGVLPQVPKQVVVDHQDRILVAVVTSSIFDKGLVRILSGVPPAPPVDSGGGGGGGCGTINGRGPFDPVLPSLVLLSAWALWRRRCIRSSSSSRTSSGTG